MGYVPLMSFTQDGKSRRANFGADANSPAMQRRRKKRLESLFYFNMETPETGINRPSSREGGSFIRHGRYGIFYGGFTSNLKMRDTWKLDIHKWQWSRLITNGKVPPQGRYGHSCNRFDKDRLVIFGGQIKQFISSRIERRNYNDIRFLDLKTGTWKFCP